MSLKKIVVLILLVISVLNFAVTIFSEPNSLVYFDGKYIGIVQKDGKFSFDFENPGTLVVTKPGYIPFEIYLTEDSTLTANLTFPSYLEINVELSDCEIYVDNRKVGSGSGIYTVPPGKREIKISKEGYTTKFITVELEPFQKGTIETSLKRTTTLKLLSPIKFSVFFNNTLIDLPTTLEVFPGEYVLKLTDDFVKSEQKIKVPNVDYFEYTVDTRKYVNVYFGTNVLESYVEVEGKIYKLRETLRIAPGTYSFRFFANGYNEIQRELKIENDSSYFFTFQPSRVFSTKTENIQAEFDGYHREEIVERNWFTKLIDKNSGNVWYGFTDGKLRNFPTTEYLILSNGYAEVNGVRYTAPMILNIPKGTEIIINTENYKGATKIEDSKIFDSVNYCVVNVYSMQIYDIYIDGKYFGKTPYFFLTLPEGRHILQARKDGIVLKEVTLNVKMGVLNEVKLD